MAACVSMSDGRLARDCHRRALQAMSSERWGQARKLLQVALDIEPHDLHRQLDFAQCLVRQRDIGAGSLLGDLMVRIVTVGDDHARMQCLHVQALHCRNLGQTQEAGRLLTAAIEIAESRCDEQAELQLLVTLGETLVREGTPGVASWILDRALDCATRLNDTAAIGRLQDIRGRLQIYRQEFEAAAKSFEQGAASCERLNLHANAAFCLAHLGHCQLATGRMTLAAESIYRGFQHALQSGHATCIGLLGSLAISHACDRGAGTPEATGVLSLMRRVSDPHSALGRGSMLLADAVGAARAGDLERSLELLEAAAANVEASRSLAFIVCYHRIRVLLSLGGDALAESLCDSMSFLATGSIRREVAGTVLHMRGLVAACRKRTSDAVALLQQAVAALPHSHYRFDAALDLAWLQLRRGEVAAAAHSIEMLRGAAALAAENGYLPARIVLRGIDDAVQSPGSKGSGWYWGADTLLPSLAVLLVDSRYEREPARAGSDLASLPSP
jgi:tetratricopeptide (TPR) repeat protein